MLPHVISYTKRNKTQYILSWDDRKKVDSFCRRHEEYTVESVTKEDSPQVNEEIMPKISFLWCSELASARVLVVRNFSLHVCFLF